MSRSPVVQSPTIAICIPSYNHANFLAGCIESVLAQDARPDEFIVRDDCSTDGTWERLASYREELLVLRNTVNVGIAKNYDRLLRDATSDYVVLLSSDDLLHSSFVRRVRRQLGNAQCVVTGCLHIGPTGHLSKKSRYHGISYLRWRHRSRSDLTAAVCRGSIFSFPGSAWERSWLLSLPALPSEAGLCVDWYWQILTAAYGAYRFDPLPLHCYRYHSANASHSAQRTWQEHAVRMLTFLLDEKLIPREFEAHLSQSLDRLRYELDEGPAVAAVGNQGTKSRVARSIADSVLSWGMRKAFWRAQGVQVHDC